MFFRVLYVNGALLSVGKKDSRTGPRVVLSSPVTRIVSTFSTFLYMVKGLVLLGTVFSRGLNYYLVRVMLHVFVQRLRHPQYGEYTLLGSRTMYKGVFQVRSYGDTGVIGPSFVDLVQSHARRVGVSVIRPYLSYASMNLRGLLVVISPSGCFRFPIVQ